MPAFFRRPIDQSSSVNNKMAKNKMAKNNVTRSSLSNSNPLTYTELEQRRVLAVGSFDDLTGILKVDLDTNQTLELGNDGEFVTINGSTDLNQETLNQEKAALKDVKEIHIVGQDLLDQDVFLDNDFSETAGVEIHSISIEDVENVTLRGNYQTTGDLVVDANGLVTNSSGSSLDIGGNASLTADAVTLGTRVGDNLDAGSLTFKVANRIAFHSNGDMELTNESSAGAASLSAQGEMRNTVNSRINVTNNLSLEAANIDVGGQENDQFNTGSIKVVAQKSATINEDSSLAFVQKSTSTNLDVTADGMITDFEADVLVQNRTSLTGAFIHIGEAGDSQFQTLDLSFNSDGDVHIENQGASHLSGSNTARDLDLRSLDQIVDNDGSDLTVTGDATLIANSIELGVGKDVILGGGLNFVSQGQVALDVESGITLEGVNSAKLATLIADGDILDDDKAQTTIQQSLRLDANKITLGDALNDVFNAGSVNFTTIENTRITENSSTKIFGVNNVNSARIITTGNLTDFEDTELYAVFNLSFAGERINLGTDVGNIFESSTLTFNSTVNMKIDMDSDVFIVSENSAVKSNITSTGDIGDHAFAEILISETASFKGVNIELGETDTDCFSVTGFLHVDGSVSENVVLGC